MADIVAENIRELTAEAPTPLSDELEVGDPLLREEFDKAFEAMQQVVEKFVESGNGFPEIVDGKATGDALSDIAGFIVSDASEGGLAAETSGV